MTAFQGSGPAQPLSEAERELRLMQARQRQGIARLEKQRKRVERAERALAERRAEQLRYMLDGRRDGLTWDDLASSSGVTRQAVQRRVMVALDSSESSAGASPGH